MVELTLEQAQKVCGDDEAIERGYLTEEVLDSAYKMARGLKVAGLDDLCEDGAIAFPVTEEILKPIEQGLKRRQIIVARDIAYHLIKA